MTWCTFKLVFKVEQRVFVDRLNLNRSGLVVTDGDTLDQIQNRNKADDNQDDIAVELHLLLPDIFYKVR